jgi:hypothetical protein
MKIEAKKNKYSDNVGWESDEQLFADVTVTWQQWLGMAGEHIYTAEILLPQILRRQIKMRELMEKRKSASLPPSLTSIYFFHCALVVENAMKGVISSKHGASIKNKMKTKAKIPKLLLGHDLNSLAKRACFKTGIDEEYILSFLTRYGIWGGKYPLPIENENYALTEKLSDGNHYMVGGYNPEVVPSFLTFCRNVYAWARLEINKSIQPTAVDASAD